MDNKEFVIELAENTKFSCFVWLYAPVTVGVECLVPAGLRFSIEQKMRKDAFYMHLYESDVSKEGVLDARVSVAVAQKYPPLYDRIQGFTFYITEQQLKSENVHFVKGNKDQLLRKLLPLHDKNTQGYNSIIKSKMEEEKDKFEDLEKMEDSDWSEFFEEKEENWYEPNIFEDEVVENICANVKYIAVEGYECVEILKKKPSERRSELLYCYQLGEDYAMANPHAISAVWYSTEDIEVRFYDEMCRSYVYTSFDYARLLLFGLIANDSYKMTYCVGPSGDHKNKSGVNPSSMAFFSIKRNDRVCDYRHQMHCVICFLAGIRNVFKDKLKDSTTLPPVFQEDNLDSD